MGQVSDMSAHWLKRMVLAAAFAVMPLQGMTAVIVASPCHGDTPSHAHESGGHDQGASHETRQDKGGISSDSTGHPCCQVTISALPVVTLPAALPDFPIRAPAPDLLHGRFIPDQPQRPPLA
jgi:hypothetical protein